MTVVAGQEGILVYHYCVVSSESERQTDRQRGGETKLKEKTEKSIAQLSSQETFL